MHTKRQIQFPFRKSGTIWSDIIVSHRIGWEIFVNYSSVGLSLILSSFLLLFHVCVCAWVFQFTRLNWTEITWHLRMKNKRFGKMCHLKTLFFDIHLKLNHRRLNIHITYSIIYEFSGWFFTFYLENVWQFICIFYAIISF